MPQAGTHDSALISLAILKVNHDQNRDYISNFVPFVAQVIREASQDEVSLPQVQRAVHETFALKMPQGALNTILHRASRLGYVERSHGIYKRDAAALAKLDLASVRATVTRQQSALLKELASFAAQRYEVNWSDGESERALLSYLSTRGMAVLTAAVEGAALDAPAPVDNSELIVNSFVAEICNSNPTAFDFLVTLVKGSMLADVLYLPGGFEGASRRFGETEFFLDTAFVLRALGFSTREASLPASELLELLERQKVRLKMFEHNRDEAVASMEYAARALSPGSSLELSAPSEFLRLEGWTSSDVEEFISQLPMKLSALGIEVVPKPPYRRRLGIDEAELENRLKEELSDQRPEARRRDIDSLAAVVRLRRGESTRSLENCRAVLVTTNGALVRVATEFFRQQEDQSGVSPVIHAHDLTWIAWLKLPTEVPDLPRLQVIADSFAALNPSDELWRRYSAEVDRLRQRKEVTSDEFHILRFSIEARRALLTYTFGDPEVFTEGSIPSILEAARKEITAKLRNELAEERASGVEKARQDEERIATERTAREQEVAKRAEIEQKITERDEKREARINERAAGIAAKVASAGFVLGAVLLAIATFLGTQILLPDAVTSLVPAAVSVAVVAVAVFSIFNGVFGTNLVDLRKRAQRQLSKRIANWLHSLSSE